MTDVQRSEPEPDGNRTAASKSPPGVPRWVKVSGIVVALLLLVLLVAVLADGSHGPGRHQMSGTVEPHGGSVAVVSAGPQYEGLTRW